MTPAIRCYHAVVKDLGVLLARVPPGVQLLRADRVFGRDHLVLAAELATRALAEGRARASDVETETLLYAAGERQIGKALAFLGLSVGTREVAAIGWDAEALDALANAEGWRQDDALLDGDAGVLDAFGVSSEERALFPRERWGDIILEKVALTDVLKT